MRNILTLLVLAITTNALAQNCDCLKELQFAIEKIETNHAGYYDKVTRANKMVYSKFKNARLLNAQKTKDEKTCTGIISEYLSFFRTNSMILHSKEDYFDFDKADSLAIANRFRDEEKISLTKSSLQQLLYKNKLKGIEGIWDIAEMGLKIGIIKKPTIFGNYVGFVINKNKYWSPGQIKFQIAKISTNKYKILTWDGTRTPKYYLAQLSENKLELDKEVTLKRTDKLSTVEKNIDDMHFSKKLEFKQLSPRTCYISIPAMDTDAYTIERLINDSGSKIMTTENLIIDLRNNWHNTIDARDLLFALILEKKKCASNTSYTFFASQENINWEENTLGSFFEKNKNNSHNNYDSYKKQIALEKENINNFTPYKFDTLKVSTVFTLPKKVSIIVNRLSGQEEFLFNAKLSKKVTIYGENTYGTCTYSDFRPQALNCLPYYFYIASAKIVLPKQIEMTGYEPDIKLDKIPEKNWLKKVQELTEKHK